MSALAARAFLLLAALTLAACSGLPRRDAAPVAAAPPTPSPVTATPVAPVAPAAPAMLVPAGELDARLQARARALAAQALGADEVGYYVDVQQARLRQIADAGLGVARDGHRLHLSMPGRLSFAVASAELSEAARASLDRLAAVLVDYDRSLLSVHGHTDDSGPPEVNQRLSAQRALAVARYLVDAGVAESRVFAVGHGAEQPLLPNTDAAAQERNRRVELRIDPLLAPVP